MSHSRPYHPQTNGKDERFHRSMDREVLDVKGFSDHQHLQHELDQWRSCYNHERPHEAIGLKVPASRYQPSPRAYPELLPDIEYGPDDIVVRVKWNGEYRAFGRKYKVSNALMGLDIALRPTAQNADGIYDVFFCHQRIGKLDLRSATK